MFRITVALPLSAGSMVRFVLSFRFFSAVLSALLRLSLGRFMFLRILTVSATALEDGTNREFRNVGVH